ncbi:hypothetical protein BXA50_15095, partial [Enterococcus faecium]
RMGKVMKKRMKPLIWPIAVSSIFLLGQTAFAETSEPAQTEPSTTINTTGCLSKKRCIFYFFVRSGLFHVPLP